MLKEEAIAKLEVIVLDAVDASEGRADIGAREVALGQAAGEQIDVLDNLVELAQLVEGVVGNEQLKFLPTANLVVETVFEVMDVAGQTVITATPDVGRNEITAPLLHRRLVQVIPHVGCDPWINAQRRT